MDTVLHGVEGVWSYLDDLKTQGNSWQQCWAATINVFRALTAAGLKINLRKCKLLVHTCMKEETVLYQKLSPHIFYAYQRKNL